MAFYHVGSCSCPIGCCDCGPSPTEKEKTEKELVEEMRKYLKPYEFTALYKDLVGEKRTHKKYPANFRSSPHWRKAFVRYVKKPDLQVVLEMGHKLHDKYKNEKEYSPKLVNLALYTLIWSGNFSQKDRDLIDKYFTNLFAYEYVEIRSEWK